MTWRNTNITIRYCLLSTWQLHCSPLIGYPLRWFAIKFTDELVAMKFDQIHYVLARELSLKCRILGIQEKFSLASFIKKILSLFSLRERELKLKLYNVIRHDSIIFE